MSPRRTLVALGVLALVVPTIAAAPDPNDGDPRFGEAESRGALSATVIPRSLDPDQTVTVVIEMEGDPVAVVEAESDAPLSDDEKAAITDNLEQQQEPVVDSVAAEGGTVEATMQSAYNGVQASVPADAVAQLAELPGVVAVRPVTTHTIGNATSVPFLGVPQVWESTGYTGENVKVAIIDTGIDFTHADFGGPGTVEAYEAADAVDTEPADPALFGPDAPRIKGGYDFVGDAYDAGDPESVPQPDPNPLDCNGHGTHVAGTAGGGGVNADGSPYTGPYDTTTPTVDFKVGPGVAPQADLYALKVFGCDGSTNLTIAAIDWAVANDMDVINMSLGSDYGRADDPTAIAASNAIGAGVVVVASAGNDGPNPYMAGSPGSGEGVISVAATDSTETFPGATIEVAGQTIQAINANGADLSAVPPLTVVNVTDNPATAENESLGCSVAAYEQAGITAGGNQLAVVSRGTCARVSKAVYGQQAGAAAVVMVNTTNDFPPFEGEILENADTGEPFTVTIPFLGVRSSDGPALRAANGQTAVLAANTLENPAFRGYASFSSGGPRGGDSGVGPDIAAPGVSIASAGVGTGSDFEVLSGTSMAAPHVAGVAALTIQSHPDWTAGQIAAAVVSTADPEGVAGQDPRIGGVGLVDVAQSVTTQVTVTGDAFRTDSGWLRETALNFGFQESWLGFFGVKTITVENRGASSVTYSASTVAGASSLPANVRVVPSQVTVPAGGSAKMIVYLTAAANSVPSSTAGPDQFSHYEFNGDVVLTGGDSILRVPYLLVPRSNSRVTATGALFNRNQQVADGTKQVTLRNVLGAIDGGADVYTWGLSDPADLAEGLIDTGYDLRSAGVQSFADGDDQLLVFAVNNWKRYSNAAANEYDVEIDTTGDGEPDYVVFSTDSGSVRTGSVNGVTEVFVVDVATGDLSATGFLASAPTDSSTVLLPVFASDLGLTAEAGAFTYTVTSFGLTVEGAAEDSIDGTAAYNAWDRALENGQTATVPRNGRVAVDIDVNAAAYQAQQPLGVMVVVYDNASGENEAVLVPVKR